MFDGMSNARKAGKWQTQETLQSEQDKTGVSTASVYYIIP